MGEAGPFLCDHTDCGKTFVTKRGLSKHQNSVHGVVAPTTRKKSMTTKSPRTDNEIITVLDVLCPKGIPVQQLPLVNNWIEQTRKMLNAVRGG